MKIFRTRIIINAPADTVWRALTDLEAHTQFDPSCTKIEGKLIVGERVRVYSTLRKKHAYRVSEIRPNEIMVWEFSWPFNLIRCVRTFVVMAKDDQTCEFNMQEVFEGHLATYTKRIPDLTDNFREFSRGLKRFIESRP